MVRRVLTCVICPILNLDFGIKCVYMQCLVVALNVLKLCLAGDSHSLHEYLFSNTNFCGLYCYVCVSAATLSCIRHALLMFVCMFTATLCVFRLSILCWLARWVMQHKHEMLSFHFCMAVMSLFVLIAMSAVLFYRLVLSDFFHTKPRTPTGVSDTQLTPDNTASDTSA